MMDRVDTVSRPYVWYRVTLTGVGPALGGKVGETVTREMLPIEFIDDDRAAEFFKANGYLPVVDAPHAFFKAGKLVMTTVCKAKEAT